MTLKRKCPRCGSLVAANRLRRRRRPRIRLIKDRCANCREGKCGYCSTRKIKGSEVSYHYYICCCGRNIGD